MSTKFTACLGVVLALSAVPATLRAAEDDVQVSTMSQGTVVLAECHPWSAGPPVCVARECIGGGSVSFVRTLLGQHFRCRAAK